MIADPVLSIIIKIGNVLQRNMHGKQMENKHVQKNIPDVFRLLTDVIGVANMIQDI